MNFRLRLVALLWLLALPAIACADDVLLLIERVPSHGLAVVPVDLTAAARRCKTGPVLPQTVAAVTADGKSVPLQFVPDEDFDGQTHAAGTIVARLAGPGSASLKLTWIAGAATGPSSSPAGEDMTVHTASYSVTHDPHKGGFPAKIEFRATGKVFDSLRFNDRLYQPPTGSFSLRGDSQSQVSKVSQGPVCSVIRTRGRFLAGDGKPPASQPQAVYDWYYFTDQPLVYVRARLTQREPFAWKEAHFLELAFPDQSFTDWIGGEPVSRGRFDDSGKSTRVPRWGSLLDGQNALAMLDCGPVTFHDGRKAYGRYMHALSDLAWGGWDAARREMSAWLWIGATATPAETFQQACTSLPTSAAAIVTTAEVHRSVEAAGAAPWRAAAQQLESQGRLDEALRASGGQLPESWASVVSGDLSMLLERTADGIGLVSLYDGRANRQLLAARPGPLFQLTLRHAETAQEIKLASDAGWKNPRICRDPNKPQTTSLCWDAPSDSRLGRLAVTLQATADPAANAIRWHASVSVDAPWSVWRVAFPQVVLAGGDGASLFTPQCAGMVKPLAANGTRWSGTYPSGWTTMPFMSVYDRAASSGLYVGVHDPLAATKDLLADSRNAGQGVPLAFDIPAPNMGRAGNGFTLEGEAVWQLFRGDWYDAAMIYRQWVRREAKWYPKLSADGRDDTPRWMRELCAWAKCSGSGQQCVQNVLDFAKALDVPVGVHWYNWHQIPFDNDYPHYFPPKADFADGVRTLQQSNVFVMPYINGRLWDTHDRGTEDFEFTRLALPAATKDEHGKCWTESYGSKESDGNRVVLAVMCPATKLWQDRQREIVLTLMGQYGVKGVYMDQIAAAKANLCFDASHGHPLGGGHWWTQDGYWPLLDAIRRQMPAGCMLTTECNADPYIRWFDGYLTWHWQYDGQVPAFPAVYGGAVQMFGRAYGSGPTRDLALRMKAGQQLVFGEQLGWIDPEVRKEKDNFAFFRQMVHLRWHLRRYFYAGEMARPPRLAGDIPTLTADWQWHGVTPVSTDAVLAGAWRIPAEKRLVLIVVNVSGQERSIRLRYDLGEHGFSGKVRLVRVTADGPGEPGVEAAVLDRNLTLPARTAWAYEIVPSAK